MTAPELPVTAPPSPDPPAARAPAGKAAPTHCENCGEPLLGGHCYSCGQPTKGLVRQFSSILGDFVDTVFNIDGRIIRTLPPLLFKPGYLSEEYFAGRRVRYVSPVRLFFFLTVLAFLFTQWTVDFDGNDGGAKVSFGNQQRGFDSLKTVAEVEAKRDEMLKNFDLTVQNTPGVPGLADGMAAAKKEVNEAANRRIAVLKSRKPEMSALPGTPGNPDTPDEIDDDPEGERLVILGSKPWHPTKNPVHFGWLPDAGNAKVNEWVGRGKSNIKRIKEEPRLMVDAVLSALPTTLCILVPVFALLLKLLYVFKRRLYMEHLIVALHSHAFLSLAMIVLVGLGELETLVGTDSALHHPIGILQLATVLWMPFYLLRMQKRVYGQGWLMTLLKYFFIGFVYLLLISFGVTATMVAAAVTL